MVQPFGTIATRFVRKSLIISGLRCEPALSTINSFG
jgi:hypothetical protein